ncbi:MAG: hypothetical protein PF483_09180 [Halothiobacillus sp.]|jgi:hypothetical protein|nr:hypothetical protein [Halothiobacillus sp.]
MHSFYPSLSLRDRLLLIALLILTGAVYWPGLSGFFVFDDFGNLVDNAAFKPEALHAHFWAALWSSDSGPTDRPLSMLSFALQGWFTGLAPWPLKLVNLLIHLVNGVLIFMLSHAVIKFVWCETGRAHQSTRWLISPNTLALLVTAAWLLTPMQLTAVLYIIQRMESLSSFFVLVGLLLYWQGRMRLLDGKKGGWWRILVGLVGCTGLAVFAKETGVMLPVYAFLLEWVLLRGRTEDGFSIRLLGLFILVLFLPGVLGVLYTLPSAINGTAYAGRPFDLAQRLWTEGRVLIDYLHWIGAPTPYALSLYHDDILPSTGWFAPWTTAASWAFIVVLITAAIWLKNRAPLFALGVLWFFAGHALVSTYIPLELAYEHRNYLPSWGVYIALFGLIFAWVPKSVERRDILRTLTLSGMLALISLYAGSTALRAKTWGDPFRLAFFEATTHPESVRANYDLARILLTAATNASSPSYQMGMKQMEKTASLPGAGIQPVQGLIFMAAKFHQPIASKWWTQLQTRIKTQPISSAGIASLYKLIDCGINGTCSYSAEDKTALERSLNLAVSLHPDDASLLTLSANFEANIAHDYSAAYALMQGAVTRDPKYFAYWQNLVTLQVAGGQLSEAKVGIERMTELNAKGIHNAAIAAAKQALAKKGGQ